MVEDATRLDLNEGAALAGYLHGDYMIHRLLVALGKHFDLRVFVETGTQAGNTVEAVRPYFEKVYSIELSEPCVEACRARFVGAQNVCLVQGSSGKELGPLLIRERLDKALIWLDAHDRSQPDQIPEELRAIKDFSPNSLVVIDDVRHGSGGYVIDDRFQFCVPAEWRQNFVGQMNLLILHRGGYEMPRAIQ